MAIAWKWQARDKDNKLVEAAPGQPFFFCRGPATAAEMIHGARILLDSKRLDAVRFGFDDPGYKMDESTLVAVKEDDDPVKAFLAGKDLKPLDLPLDKAVLAEHDKLIAEHEEAAR